MEKVIKIREPYYSAGKKYNWPYKPIGVGISKAHFKGETIRITIGDDPAIYSIETQKALELVRRYKAFQVVKSVHLGILPLDQFQNERRVNDSQMKLI